MGRVVSYKNLRIFVINEKDKQTRLNFLFGQLKQLETQKKDMVVSHYENLKEKIHRYIVMVENNREFTFLNHYKSKNSLEKFMI